MDRALKAVRGSIRTALKGLNAVAGQAMSKGRYEEAQALAEKAKAMTAFASEVEDLRRRWKSLLGRGGSAGRLEKSPATPLWSYYQPILQALVDLGGAASRKEFEPVVGTLMKDILQPGDFDTMAHGRKRWQRQILLSHRHLLAEGWIEDQGREWAITPEGRKAAKAKPTSGLER